MNPSYYSRLGRLKWWLHHIGDQWVPTLQLHNLNLSAQGSEGGIGAQGIEVCPSEVGWTLCGQHLQINTFIQIESEGGGEGGNHV